MGEIIERFTAKNYGCLKDVTVALTPLHAFIGPNDSGKSTLLRGVRTVVQFAARGFWHDQTGSLKPFDPGLVDWFSPNAQSRSLELTWGEMTYRVGQSGAFAPADPNEPEKPGEVDDEVLIRGERAHSKHRSLRARPTGGERHDDSSLFQYALNKGVSGQAAWSFFMRGPRMLRLDPNALRAPSKLLASLNAVDFEDENGRGLAGIYDVILNQHLEGYLSIQENLRKLFPSVKSLGLQNMSDSTKEIRVQLWSGEWIPGGFVSEGMLYYLAFEAIRYLSPGAVLLIEEPENGLHPARIVEVMQVLREISKTTQILLATHSPLVINEMQPEEVSVVTRNPETGTKITPMKETAHFEKRSSVYALGELWLSFADGKEETTFVMRH